MCTAACLELSDVIRRREPTSSILSSFGAIRTSAAWPLDSRQPSHPAADVTAHACSRKTDCIFTSSRGG